VSAARIDSGAKAKPVIRVKVRIRRTVIA